MGLIRKRPAAASAPAATKRRKCTNTKSSRYDKLWKDQKISAGWTARGARYWESQPADMVGMTGDPENVKGGGVSRPDIEFSRKALQDALKAARKVRKGGKKVFKTALELGAGIGRVTKGVLMDFCGHIHLVDFKKFLQEAKKSLPRAGCRFTFHHSSMQKFQIKVNTFDLIWCQWLLMYLTDADAVGLLKRASAGLADDGLFIVKENVPEAKRTQFEDAEDRTWTRKAGKGKEGGPVCLTRTQKHFEHLFKRANLQICGSRLQPGDHRVPFETMMFWVLVPMDRHGGSERRLLS